MGGRNRIPEVLSLAHLTYAVVDKRPRLKWNQRWGLTVEVVVFWHSHMLCDMCTPICMHINMSTHRYITGVSHIPQKDGKKKSLVLLPKIELNLLVERVPSPHSVHYLLCFVCALVRALAVFLKYSKWVGLWALLCSKLSEHRVPV